MTRSRVAPLAAAVIGTVLLAACSAAPFAAPDATPSPLLSAVDEPPEPVVDGRFPVTVRHFFGETVVPRAPKRIVTVSDGDLDTLLGLGITPIAKGQSPVEPYGPVPAPWRVNRYRGGIPVDLPKGPGPYADPAMLSPPPDLIIAVASDITIADYDYLRHIAPTISEPVGADPQSGTRLPFTVALPQQARMIGQAVGRPVEAERLIAELNAGTARSVAAHPRLAGKTAACVDYSPTRGSSAVYVSGPDDVCGWLFAALGMRAATDLHRKSEESDWGIYADVVAADPPDVVLVSGQVDLRKVTRGRLPPDLPVVELDDPLSARLSVSTLLTLPGLPDAVAPALEKAVG